MSGSVSFNYSMNWSRHVYVCLLCCFIFVFHFTLCLVVNLVAQCMMVFNFFNEAGWWFIC